MNRKALLLIFSLSAFFYGSSQKSDKDETVDTTSKTNIERLLRATSITKKVEFVEVDKVNVLKFQIIIVTNLTTGLKYKGLYLSNQASTFWSTATAKGERHAYLDEAEIDDLIVFLENCDAKWKKEKPVYQTQYEFETLDHLRIRFWTPKNSTAWAYSVKFTDYVFDNTETLGKSQSDDLLDALRQVKAELKNH